MWVILVVDVKCWRKYVFIFVLQRAQWSGACWPTLRLAVLSLWVVDSRCSSSFLASTRLCKSPSLNSQVFFESQLKYYYQVCYLFKRPFCIVFSISLLMPVIMPIKVSWTKTVINSVSKPTKSLLKQKNVSKSLHGQLPCKEAPYSNWKVTDFKHSTQQLHTLHKLRSRDNWLQ